MASDGVVLRGEDSFVKYILNCFSVIRVSTAAGEAEETAACRDIHYCGPGRRGQIMGFSSLCEHQNQVCPRHAVGPAGPGLFAETPQQDFSVTKIITGYEFVGKIKKTVGGKSKRPHLNPTKLDSFQPGFISKELIRDTAFITSELAPARKQSNCFLGEQGDRCPHPEAPMDTGQPI